MHRIGAPSRNGIVGATLGLRAYRGRAEIAARQFAWATGLGAVVVGDEDHARIAELFVRHCPASLAQAEMPYAAKFFLFDLIGDLVDCERLVFFDADLVFVNRWDPAALDAGMMHVVRDRWWEGNVQADCRVWDIPIDRYFNTGFFAVDRSSHAALLHEAAHAWDARCSALHEQAPLNGAAARLAVKLNFLPREFNLIGGNDTAEAGRHAVTGLHLGGWTPESAYCHAIEACQGKGEPCLPADESGAVGTWLYGRGREWRRMELWPDGMVGPGGAGCERYWRVWLEGERQMLAVFGNAENEARITETFRCTRDGETWRGRWNRSARSEVVLRRAEAGRSTAFSVADRIWRGAARAKIGACRPRPPTSGGSLRGRSAENQRRNVLTASEFMGPSHRHKELAGPWLESAFHREVIERGATFAREYVAGYWTDYIVNRGDPGTIRAYFNRLPPESNYFTVIQHDDGFQGDWPKNLLVFGAGGVGDIAIPLLLPGLKPDFTARQRSHRVSFMGAHDGPSDAAGVRSAMIAAMCGCADFRHFTRQPYGDYCRCLRESVFVLCPRGYGRTSFRLYETLAMNSIPVYIWDDVEWLPYKDVLDWSEFSISVNVREISDLPGILASIDDAAIDRMLEAARVAHAGYFTARGLVSQVQAIVHGFDLHRARGKKLP